LQLSITHWVRINDQHVIKDGKSLLHADAVNGNAEDIYRALQYNYPKFFKMDMLCKWAWLGAELLLTEAGNKAYDGLDHTRIAAVITTAEGCMDVDKKYQETLATIPSPALFVYTLPNIMLGEIAIRHGLKGEQVCLVSDKMDAAELCYWANDLLQNRNMDACLCGWVDATETKKEVILFWVTKGANGMPFNTKQMEQLINTTI
jgi:3-oxoacyl-(acyl-carrier-protein) synthase